MFECVCKGGALPYDPSPGRVVTRGVKGGQRVPLCVCGDMVWTVLNI